jgi:hypothetical protein
MPILRDITVTRMIAATVVQRHLSICARCSTFIYSTTPLVSDLKKSEAHKIRETSACNWQCTVHSYEFDNPPNVLADVDSPSSLGFSLVLCCLFATRGITLGLGVCDALSCGSPPSAQLMVASRVLQEWELYSGVSKNES